MQPFTLGKGQHISLLNDRHIRLKTNYIEILTGHGRDIILIRRRLIRKQGVGKTLAKTDHLNSVSHPQPGQLQRHDPIAPVNSALWRRQIQDIIHIDRNLLIVANDVDLRDFHVAAPGIVSPCQDG